MTYNVFGGTLCLTQSINQSIIGLTIPVISVTRCDYEGDEMNAASSPGVIVAIVIIIIIVLAIAGAVFCYVRRRQGKR